MPIKEKVLFAGFGGQGVLSLGKIFAEVCIENGLNASWLPSYGPEMRGGTCNCQVVFTDGKILSPIFSRPSIAIIMNQLSLDRFAASLSNSRVVVLNTSLIVPSPEQEQLLAKPAVVRVAATDQALAVGSVRFANIVMLGAYARHSREMPLEMIKVSIARKFKDQVAEDNIRALEAGYRLA